MSIIQDSYYKRYVYSLRGELGVQYISEPIGWNDDDKIFKRSTDTHGVFINLSNNLEFYIGDNKNNGGYEYLKQTYDIYGINAKVTLVKEEDISGTLKEVYRGYLDFSTYLKKPYTISIKFNESGLYEKIKARNSEDLELDRLTTMNGSVLEPMRIDRVALDGRKVLIVNEFKRSTDINSSENGVSISSNNDYCDAFVGSTRIDDHYQYGAVAVPLTLTVEQSGNAQTIYGHYVSVNNSSSYSDATNHTEQMFYINESEDVILNIGFEVGFIKTSSGLTNEVRLDLIKYSNGNIYNFNSYINLIKLNNVVAGQYIYYKGNINNFNLLANESLCLAVHFDSIDRSYHEIRIDKASINMIEYTSFSPSQSNFVMPFESLDRIINIITDEPNRLKSNALGRTDIGYDNDGYASLTGLTNGFWVREFNTEKITTSFQDFIDSFKCVWQLGYGIEKNGFDEIVRVEHISHFYQNAVTLKLNAQPNKITRKCAKEYFYSSLEIGYSQPSGTILYEEALGLDEYNTRNNFTTAITRIENKFTNVSKYRADSYGTEFARRKPRKSYPEEDTRYDLSVMILDLKRGVNELFQQRKWEDDFVVPTPFTKDTAGVYSPETATNLRFSPINVLLRWGFWIKGGFMKNLNEYVMYSSSNGNSKLATQKNEVGGVLIAENSNVLNSDLDENLFNPDIISFEFSVDYDMMNTLNGRTLFNGEEIMNYYGLVEFINEEGNYEYGFLMSLEQNNEGKWELLSSTKRISKISSNTGLTSRMMPPINLTLQDNTNDDIGSVILVWEKAAAQEGISHYRIYMNGNVVANTIDESNYKIINNLQLNIEYSFYVLGVTKKCRVTDVSNVVKITLTNTHINSNNLDFNLNKYL